MSCDTQMLPVKKRTRWAVVIVLSKAHDHGHTSCVYCLKLRRDKEGNHCHVTGNPFRLSLRVSDQSGRYICKNIDLRKEGIEEGSIIVVDQDKMFVNNTKEKMVSFLRLHDKISNLSPPKLISLIILFYAYFSFQNLITQST